VWRELDTNAARGQAGGDTATPATPNREPHRSLETRLRATYRLLQRDRKKQLIELATRRIQTGDDSPITDDDIETIRTAVKAKVEDAVMSNQPIWSVFWQDDNLGFTYRAFRASEQEIVPQTFDFPEIANEDSSNRFVLSGALAIDPLPSDPVDTCAAERAAVEAKKDEIASLHTRVRLFLDELHHAIPQQKPALVAEIEATNAEVAEAEAELPALQECPGFLPWAPRARPTRA
jgi:hypothetical protein